MTAAPVRRRGWVFLVLVLIGGLGLLVWGHGHRTVQPHRVPVAVQGPAAVAQPVVDRLNALPGEPVRAVVLAADADPRKAVRDGAVVATVVVDPAQPTNALVVATVADPAMTALAEQLAGRVSKPMARTFTTSAVPPSAHAGVGRRVLAVTSGLWVAGGFLLAGGWSLLRRRRGAGTARAGYRDLLVLVAGCAGWGVLVAAVAATRGAPFLTWVVLGLLVTATTALATAALDALLGTIGVLLAGTLFVFLAGPVMSGRDTRLLPGVWSRVAPWTLAGAARELTAGLVWFGGGVRVRPALELAGVLVVAVLVLALVARSSAEPATPGSDSGPSSSRWRVLAVAIPVALSLVALTWLAPSGAEVVSATRVPGASETTCVGTPKISTLTELNDFVTQVRGGPAFQGADVGADVGLQDGRRLWVFGDTLRAPEFSGQRFVRNSMLVLGQGCARSVVPADKGAVVPDRADGIGYWPMSIARVQRNGYDLVGMVTQRVHGTDAPDGAYAFETLGSSVALFVAPVGKTPQLLAQEDVGPDDPNPAHPEYGAAAAVQGDWIYLYGTARPQQKGVFGFSLRVARTRIEDLLHPDRWTYWDGHTWQGSAAKARQLIAADHGVSQTLSVFERGGRWYAVSKRDEVFGSDLVVWTAPAPTGPWDGGTKVATLSTDLSTGQLRYMPLAHPDLGHDGAAKMLVSYSRNNTDVTKVENDPFLYRPEFLEVTLPAR